MFTPEQQLDNLIRWRDELASGKWKKCEYQLDNGRGSHCANGVAIVSPELPVSWGDWDFAETDDYPACFGVDWEFVFVVSDVNNSHPGDNYAAVIEYLNEEITRRKVALGVPVNDTESHQAAAVECEAVRA